MMVKLLDLEPQRRDALLNAALREFTLKGYDGASTNTIAKEAGMSKALMFHYVNSKQDLFLFVYDYFAELLDMEYFNRMDLTERDIFRRLRQSYLLQIELLRQYPWIFEFNKLSAATGSDEVNRELKKRARKKQSVCAADILAMTDDSPFRPGLDTAQCKQFILWANIGFTNDILEEMRKSGYSAMDYAPIVEKIDGHFAELRKIFYKTGKDRK